MFCVVVTSNYTPTFALNFTETFLQVAKIFFSKTEITTCSGLRVPARYRRERPSKVNGVIGDIQHPRPPLETDSLCKPHQATEEWKQIRGDSETEDKKAVGTAERCKPHSTHKKIIFSLILTDRKSPVKD
jgi:hypothetical protein